MWEGTNNKIHIHKFLKFFFKKKAVCIQLRLNGYRVQYLNVENQIYAFLGEHFNVDDGEKYSNGFSIAPQIIISHTKELFIVIDLKW